jgi:hypothetical protein
MWRSQHQSLLCSVYRLQVKRGGKESKLYVALVTPGSSAGVKYRHGVAFVSFFSRDMWVLLWVTGVGSVLPVGQKYKV